MLELFKDTIFAANNSLISYKDKSDAFVPLPGGFTPLLPVPVGLLPPTTAPLLLEPVLVFELLPVIGFDCGGCFEDVLLATFDGATEEAVDSVEPIEELSIAERQSEPTVEAVVDEAVLLPFRLYGLSYWLLVVPAEETGERLVGDTLDPVTLVDGAERLLPMAELTTSLLAVDELTELVTVLERLSRRSWRL